MPHNRRIYLPNPPPINVLEWKKGAGTSHGSGRKDGVGTGHGAALDNEANDDRNTCGSGCGYGKGDTWDGHQWECGGLGALLRSYKLPDR